MTAELGLSLFGRRIVGCFLPPYLHRWLRAAWGHDPSDASDPVYRIDVCGRTAGSPPQRTETGRIERPGLWIGGADGDWWFRTGHGEGELRLGKDRAQLDLWPREAADDRATPFYEGVFLLLGTALSATGLVPLHASAARPPDSDEAHVFIAASGTGKSTTLLRLAMNGWRPIMEDFGWVDPASGTICGWDVGIRVGEETRRRFAGRLKGAEWTPGPDGKALLAYERLGAPPPRRARVGPIVLLERDPARPAEWRDAHPHEAVRALWESAGALLAPAARESTSRWIAERVRSGGVRWFNLGEGGLPQA